MAGSGGVFLGDEGTESTSIRWFQKQLSIRVDTSTGEGCSLIEANSWVVWAMWALKGGSFREVVLLDFIPV